MLFIHSGVLVNVNGQKISPWGESLLSAVHVDLTPFSVQSKNTSRCVAEYTNTLPEYGLCLGAIRRDFALRSRVTEFLMLDNPRHVE